MKAPVSLPTAGNNLLPERAPVRESTRLRATDTYLETACLDNTDKENGVNPESGSEDLERARILRIEEQTSVRRSARERRPRQIYTYEMLGQPAIYPYLTMNSVTAYPIPHMPVWGLPNYTMPITYPHLYLPPVHTPYVVTTAVY